MSDAPVVVAIDMDDRHPLRAAVEGAGLEWVAASLPDAGPAIARTSASRRVAVVGSGPSGEGALEAAAETGGVHAVALVGAPLSVTGVELVSSWPELPILALADPADRPALRGAVDAVLASAHDSSDIVVGPLDEATAAFAAGWLADRVRRTAQVEDVVISSADGIMLQGAWDQRGGPHVWNGQTPIPLSEIGRAHV